MLLVLPNVDPIPIPAPVWLFKLLHVVTLILHFVAVQLILGGLTIATIWNGAGRDGSPMRGASDSIIGKLPTVMTYVINFGVPPLLFAQVLYGQALYSSSVIIGFYWIMVIFLLIAGYYLLYLAGSRADKGAKWWWMGVVSLLLLAYIARIYTTNMTLMLTPDKWLELYRASGGLGHVMPSGDPTVLPRFLFMTIGSLGLAGIGIAFLGAFFGHRDDVKSYLIKKGSLIGAIFVAVQLACGYWVFSSQPDAVKNALFGDSLGLYGSIVWGVASVGALAAAGISAMTGNKLTAAAAALFGFLMTSGAVVARDAIRDISLNAIGFDVWNRTVVANWQVVGIFLVLFVAALALIAYLLVLVSKSAKEVAKNAQ